MANDEQQAGSGGAAGSGGGGLRSEARQAVRKARRAKKAAGETRGQRDDRAARSDLRVARTNAAAARATSREVRKARSAVREARDTPGKKDDRTAKRTLRNAREAKAKVREAVRAGEEYGTGSTASGDVLSKRELADRYEYAFNLLKSDPELWGLFRRASNAKKGQWTAEKFAAELKTTDWWQRNNRWARAALNAQAAGGADWEEQQAAARDAMARLATEGGIQWESLDAAEKDRLVHRYLFEGWSDPARRDMAMSALANRTDYSLAGGADDEIQGLRDRAAANGLNLSEGWFQSAARSMQAGLSDVGDWEAVINEQGATQFPAFADRIRSGELTAMDAASPFINRMAQTLELNPEQVTLDDPLIRKALGGVDEAGNPTYMSLWQLEQEARKDPRWGYTDNAYRTVGDTAQQVLQMFGMR
jgi:hypothetical protein